MINGEWGKNVISVISIVASTSSEQQFGRQKHLVGWEVDREWLDWFWVDGKVTQITTLYYCGEQKNISEYIKPWGGWATTANGYIRFHFCQPRTESWGYSGHKLTKTRQLKPRKPKPGLMNLYFCWGIQVVGLEFGASQHETMDPTWLVSTVQACWRCNGCGGMFSWHTLDPLIPVYHCLNATAYLSIVADHVNPFMATMYPSSNNYFQHDKSPKQK